VRTREKAPIYVLGAVDPVSFSRGKRGIAGSLIFTNFDRHAMWDIMQQASYVKKTTDMYAGGLPGTPGAGEGDSLFPDPVDAIEFGGAPTDGVNYTDQIPPFDVTLTAVNELGQAMWMRVIGIDLLNEGQGISIDDITIETQMTFIARSIVPWTPVNNDFSAIREGRSFSVGVSDAGDIGRIDEALPPA
tara:strand:- start:222 stop:788 length:567 start_codon:yes stop_codon:yes gene_type:complete